MRARSRCSTKPAQVTPSIARRRRRRVGAAEVGLVSFAGALAAHLRPFRKRLEPVKRFANGDGKALCGSERRHDQHDVSAERIHCPFFQVAKDLSSHESLLITLRMYC